MITILIVVFDIFICIYCQCIASLAICEIGEKISSLWVAFSIDDVFAFFRWQMHLVVAQQFSQYNNNWQLAFQLQEQLVLHCLTVIMVLCLQSGWLQNVTCGCTMVMSPQSIVSEFWFTYFIVSKHDLLAFRVTDGQRSEYSLLFRPKRLVAIL